MFLLEENKSGCKKLRQKDNRMNSESTSPPQSTGNEAVSPASKKSKKYPGSVKPRSRIKLALSRLLLVILSTGFCLLFISIAGEIWVRSRELPSDTGSIYVIRDGQLPRAILRPGAAEISTGVPVRINSLGFRGREYTREKPAGTTRILILGDSFAFGAGAPVDVIFPTRLETRLNSEQLFGLVEILNLGVSDYNTDDELAWLQEFGLGLTPDLVILVYVMNDIEIKQEYLPRSAEEPSRLVDERSGEVRQYRDPLYWLVNRLRRDSHFLAYLAPRMAALGRKLGLNLPSTGSFYGTAFANDVEGWKRSKAAIEQMRDLGLEHHFQFALVLFPLMTNFTDAYPAKKTHEVIAEYTRAQDIPFLDLLPNYMGINAASLWVSPTDGHPNAEGHRIAAEAIYEFLIKTPQLLQPPKEEG